MLTAKPHEDQPDMVGHAPLNPMQNLKATKEASVCMKMDAWKLPWVSLWLYCESKARATRLGFMQEFAFQGLGVIHSLPPPSF